MDIQALGARAVLVPTPGQTEQVCLANDLRKKGFCGALEQNTITWTQLQKELARAKGFPIISTNASLLQEAITSALQLIGTK
jgi:UDP-N-acetylglucosamine:LPS N-acetylglucosamine transferase